MGGGGGEEGELGREEVEEEGGRGAAGGCKTFEKNAKKTPSKLNDKVCKKRPKGTRQSTYSAG